MLWPARRHHAAGVKLEIGDVADARPMNLIVDCNLTILYITCNFSNANTFFRSALYSATTCYKLGRLRQLLTSQEDIEGGAIIFIFKKVGAYRESAKIPRRTKMTHRSFCHQLSVINNKILPKQTKAMDMQFHWLHNCKTLLRFCIYWGLGKSNLVDYFTKHHPTSHHSRV